MLFVIKILISSLIIAGASWLAGRSPALAGFIVALPLVSILSIALSYMEYQDMDKINQFAVSILISVPLSLFFFIPFVLNKWIKMNFSLTFTLGIGCLAMAYFLHHFIFKILSNPGSFSR